MLIFSKPFTISNFAFRSKLFIWSDRTSSFYFFQWFNHFLKSLTVYSIILQACIWRPTIIFVILRGNKIFWSTTYALKVHNLFNLKSNILDFLRTNSFVSFKMWIIYHLGIVGFTNIKIGRAS